MTLYVMIVFSLVAQSTSSIRYYSFETSIYNHRPLSTILILSSGIRLPHLTKHKPFHSQVEALSFQFLSSKHCFLKYSSSFSN